VILVVSHRFKHISRDATYKNAHFEAQQGEGPGWLRDVRHDAMERMLLRGRILAKGRRHRDELTSVRRR
jgi:hypothetical protein